MRTLLSILITALTLGAAAAQTDAAGDKPGAQGTATSGSGTTNLPAHQENRQQQPQGDTGPVNTTTGGAPAASPQGETPAGMQAAPEGSSKRIEDSQNK